MKRFAEGRALLGGVFSLALTNTGEKLREWLRTPETGESRGEQGLDQGQEPVVPLGWTRFGLGEGLREVAGQDGASPSWYVTLLYRCYQLRFGKSRGVFHGVFLLRAV